MIKSIVKITGVVSLMFAISCYSKEVKMPEASFNQIEQEVQQSFKGLAEAVNAIDVKGYFAFFDHEKFVGLNADGTNWNSIEDLERLIYPSFELIQKVESLVFTNVRISVIDANTAILVNEYEQRVLLKSGELVDFAGGGTQVWSKASGRWKLVSVSASVKPSAAKS